MAASSAELKLFLDGAIGELEHREDDDVHTILAIGKGNARLVSSFNQSAFTENELLEIGCKVAHFAAAAVTADLSQNGGIRQSGMTPGKLFESGKRFGSIMASSLTAERLADEGKIGNTLEWNNL